MRTPSAAGFGKAASRRAACLFIAIALGTSAGCGGNPPWSLVDPLAQPSSSARQAQRWDMVLAGSLHRPHEDVQRWREQYGATPPADAPARRALRDAVAYAVLAWIDEQHERCRIRLAIARSANDSACDLAVIGLSSAAALAGGVELKSALAAAASSLAGANSAVNQNFLHEQTAAAIVAQMDAGHLRIRAAIALRLREDDDAAYPLAAVDLDLIDCLYAGGVVSAVASLADEAALRRIEAAGAPARVRAASDGSE